jgi:single-strand DNA-binding protein
MEMNAINITGRLTADPELSDNNGREVCDMRIAENGPRGTTTFVDVAVFGRQAKACGEHLAKGARIAVAGHLRYSEWQAEDGSKRSRHSIVARRVEFLDRAPEQTEQTEQAELAVAA